MLEIKGRYNKAKVYTDTIDSSAVGLLTALLNQESVKDSQIRIMPDVHAGKGCVIGTTMTIKDKVIPNIVGSDIGCGVLVVKLKERHLDYTKLDSYIRKEVAIVRKKEHSRVDKLGLDKLKCNKGGLKSVRLGFATLGGGNHFIEIDKDDNGDLYLLIHTGSRSLGTQVAAYYQDIAFQESIVRKNGGTLEDKLSLVKGRYVGKELKRQEDLVRKAYSKTGDVPYELAYVTGENYTDYVYDMKITQEYARMNRRTIADMILSGIKVHETESFDTIHNYIDLESGIVRKGSVSAKDGEKLIIPINMRDGSLLCIGKGNPDWNYSAPHGAGRLLSRAEAKASVSVSEFKQTMKDAKVFTTCVGRATVDESPSAYKDVQTIISNIHDTVDIVTRLLSVYNFKGGTEDD